jgi:hypothetical protein
VRCPWGTGTLSARWTARPLAHGVTAIAAVPATTRQPAALVIRPGTSLRLFRQQLLIQDGTPVIDGLNHLDSTVVDTHLVLVRPRPEAGRT